MRFQIMSESCDLHCCFCGFFLICIEELVTCSALIMCPYAIRCTGGRYFRYEFAVIVAGRNDPAVCFDLSGSCFVAEVLAASLTAPVCAASCFLASRCHCFMRFQIMCMTTNRSRNNCIIICHELPGLTGHNLEVILIDT